jgi:hypothetical protein
MKQQILYIASSTRSGSTLLDYTLGKHANVVGIGEYCNIYGHYVKEGPGNAWDWKCSCGQTVDQCEFWSELFLNHEGQFEMKPTIYQYSLLTFLKFWIGGKSYLKSNKRTKHLVEKYFDTQENIYRKHPEISLIVDSSKDPFHLLLYLTLNHNKLKVIHLIRDGRAVVHSMTRTSRSFSKCVLSWFSINLLIELIKIKFRQNFITIKYEDFCRDPEAVLSSISSFVDVELIDDNNKEPIIHNICGSPHRFKFKNAEIRLDERYKNNYNFGSLLKFLFTGGVLNWIYNYSVFNLKK